MYRINQSHGCKPLTCDHSYGAKYGTEGTLLHVVRPQWHPCPRCAPTMAVHVVRPQWLSTLCAHNGCPRCVPTMASLSTLCAHNGCPRCAPMHNGCPRCAPTMASLSTLCAHNGILVHVVRPQWRPCPCCAPA